jgi:hypothetical protein
MNDLSRQARVVIIGGGVEDCWVGCHRAKPGWQDMLLSASS